MHKIKEVLRLTHVAQLSQRQVAASLRISQAAVSKYLGLAQAAGLSTWPLPPEWDDTQLEHRLFPPSADAANPSRYADPDFAAIHQELKRKGVTRQLLWEEYQHAHPDDGYGYAQYCVLYRDWKGRLQRSLRQTHRAGEKLFVDYAGPTVPVVNTRTGEITPAQIFVAVLGASNYTYAEATWTQTLPDWIGAHVRALTFFGGVPALIVPEREACPWGAISKRRSRWRAATSPNSIPPTPTGPRTTAPPCCPRARTSQKIRPRSKSACKWWSAGSWHDCDITRSSVWRS